MCGVPTPCFSNILEICAVSPPRFEHLTRFPKLKCVVSPLHLIIKHLITLVVSLAQLVSPRVALPAELVLYFLIVLFCHFLPFLYFNFLVFLYCCISFHPPPPYFALFQNISCTFYILSFVLIFVS